MNGWMVDGTDRAWTLYEAVDEIAPIVDRSADAARQLDRSRQREGARTVAENAITSAPPSPPWRGRPVAEGRIGDRPPGRRGPPRAR
jgi:hypothetical protein